jgi:transcription termination factor Rho
MLSKSSSKVKVMMQESRQGFADTEVNTTRKRAMSRLFPVFFIVSSKGRREQFLFYMMVISAPIT